MQDDLSLEGTVADNISILDAPTDMVRIDRVAGRAHIRAEIESLPMRFDSLLAKGATDISGDCGDAHHARPHRAPQGFDRECAARVFGSIRARGNSSKQRSIPRPASRLKT
jgi:hypothetical protein